MLFLRLLASVVTFAHATELTPKASNDFNVNPSRAKVEEVHFKGLLGRMCYTRSVLKYLQKPSFREACKKYNSTQKLQINANTSAAMSKMSCSRAIYNSDSGYASFVPLRVASGSYLELMTRFTATLSADIEIFVHFDDAILDWNSRTRKGFLTYTSSIRYSPEAPWELVSLIDRIHQSKNFLPNFDGLSLMRIEEQIQVSVLTRFKDENLSTFRELNRCSSLKFTCDIEFKVAHSRTQLTSQLRFLQLKKFAKGVPWVKDPRFLTLTPLFGQPRPALHHLKVTRKLAAEMPKSPEKLLPGIRVPLKRSSSPKITHRKPPSQQIEPIRRCFTNLNFKDIPNKYRKELPSKFQLIKRTPVLPANKTQLEVKKEAQQKKSDILDSPTSISEVA